VFAQYINIVVTDELLCSTDGRVFVIEHSKATLESNGDKSSPCFRPFWLETASTLYLCGLHYRLHFNTF